MIRIVSAAFLAAAILNGQAPAPEIAPAAQPDLQAFSQAVRALRRTSMASDEVKAKADALLAEGGRRAVANAYLALNGKAWDEQQALEWSLALRPDASVADSALPLVAHLTQTYPAVWKAPGAMKLRLSLYQDGKLIRALGQSEFFARDLIEQPFGMDADLAGIADGSYVLRAELVAGDTPVFRADAPFQAVKGIALDRAAVEARLAKIQGHEGAKATVRYPYILGATVNAGRRQLSAADFGLPFSRNHSTISRPA
jgi:hypothetical protein